MDSVLTAMQAVPGATWIWSSLAWLSVAYLLALGTVGLVRPTQARRFFSGFASTFTLNCLEAAFRGSFGLGLMGVSPASRAPLILFCIGAMLVVTAVGLVVAYPLHKRYASWAVPFAQKYLVLLAIGALVLAAGLIWVLTP